MGGECGTATDAPGRGRITPRCSRIGLHRPLPHARGPCPAPLPPLQFDITSQLGVTLFQPAPATWGCTPAGASVAVLPVATSVMVPAQPVMAYPMATASTPMMATGGQQGGYGSTAQQQQQQPAYAPQQPYAQQQPYAPQQPYAQQQPYAPQQPYAQQQPYAPSGQGGYQSQQQQQQQPYYAGQQQQGVSVNPLIAAGADKLAAEDPAPQAMPSN